MCYSINSSVLPGVRAIPEPLNLTVSLRGSHEIRQGSHIVRLIGQLDAFSEPVFRKEIMALLTTETLNLIFDLSDIDFIDSSGLGALVQIAKHVKDGGATLQFVTNSRVMQTFKMVRLEKFFTLRATLDDAIANLPATE